MSRQTDVLKLQMKELDVEQGLDLGGHAFIDAGVLDKEAVFLYSLAKNVHASGVIVNLGTWKGKSAIYLAKGSLAGSGKTVFSVDPYIGAPETRRIFKENISKARLDHFICHCDKKSEEVAKEWKLPVSLLFIDGAHDYESVKNDVTLWQPNLSHNSIVCFHDRRNYNVLRVIVSYVLFSGQFSKFHLFSGIFFCSFCRGWVLHDTFIKLWLILSLIPSSLYLSLPSSIRKYTNFALRGVKRLRK